MMKIMSPLCIAALLAFAVPSIAQAPPPVPRLSVCGKTVTSSPALAVRQGVLMGSWTDCARAAGATAAWDPDTQKLTVLSPRGKRLTVGPGESFTVERETRSLSPAAALVDGEIVAPLKPLFEALDGVFAWNPRTQAAQVWGRLLKLEAHGDDGGVAVTIVTSLPTQPSLQTVKSPRKAYVDLPNTILGNWRETTYINEAGVLLLRCGQFSKQPPKSRIATDLRADGPMPTFESRQDGCGGRLIFGKVQGDEPLLDRARPKLLKVLSGCPQPDTAIVTAFVSDPVEPEYDVLRQPYRVLLDLPGVEMPGTSADLADDLPFVENLRLLEQGRLVLYIKELVPFSIRKLTSPERLQIIFKREKLAGKKIMVDAGHGGKDPGARGRALQEKIVNLDVARRTASRLALMDAEPYLTRDDDTLIDLYARPRMTNQLPADLFVSIHCNAAARRDTGAGTQTYYCHPQSKELAIVMQDSLAPALRRKDGGVHQARFCVIRETQIPAILVELLFIDNQSEEALLARPEVRQSAAAAICEGIRQYLEGTKSIAPALLQEPSG
jgi:N-acetylmuramoyl-L-alanine amidase